MTILRLAPQLTRARLRVRQGNGWLDVLAIIAFTVASWLALTVAGGTHMFYQRTEIPPAKFQAMIMEGYVGATYDYDPVQMVLRTYFTLAIIACILLVFPIYSLGAAAARLGARGRAQRLAALRLIGMSGSEVIVLSLFETFLQVLLGIALGTGLWLVTVPLWHVVSFQTVPISPSEMMMPASWICVVLAAVVLISLASTALGLRRVRISPLGVAQRTTAPALHWGRLLLLLIAGIIFLFIQGNLRRETLSDLEAIIIPLLVVAAVLLTAYLVAPWFIQLLSRPAILGSRPARLLGIRRVTDDPRRAWRTIAAVCFLILVATITTTMSVVSGDDRSQTLFANDVRRGVFITLAIGFIVSACSTVMNQSAEIIDRAGELRSLAAAGFPVRSLAAIRRYQALVPLLIGTVMAMSVGFLLLTPLLQYYEITASSLRWLGMTVLTGYIMIAIAVELSTPLERQIVKERRRRND